MREQERDMIVDPIVTLPVIDAGRFRLRPMRKSDAGLLALYAGDQRVARGTRDIPHPLPPGLAESWIARALGSRRTDDTWVIDGTTSAESEMLGLIWLTPMDRGQSEIAYWVAPGFWNAGIASQAVRALVEANPRGDRHFFAEVFQDNPASARVLTNAGFEYLGDAEAYSLARDAKVKTWTYCRKL
jgi:RimJ/RimL family protein N-acetyltransferase